MAEASQAKHLITNSFIYDYCGSVVNDALDLFKSNNNASIDWKPECEMKSTKKNPIKHNSAHRKRNL